MKLNIAYPEGGGQKLITFENDQPLRIFMDKRIGAEVPGDSLGAEWKGYVFRITGGCDKDGFPMRQGVLTAGRVRLLLTEQTNCYHPLRVGERKRKSVRGCIVNQNLSVLNIIIVKKGEGQIPGLTDKQLPVRLGPKRASKIRRLFNLDKKDDVRKYVVRRPLESRKRKDGVREWKPRQKAPKIQRLITPLRLQRKRHRVALKKRRAQKNRDDKAEYLKLLAERTREARERKLERKRSRSSRLSASRTSASESAPKEAAGPKAKVAKTDVAKQPAKPAAPAKAAPAAQKPKEAAAPAKAAAPAAPKPKEAAAAKPKEAAAPKPKEAAPAQKPKEPAAAKPAPAKQPKK